MRTRRRAYIYVIREKDGVRQLLVFHEDDPEAGIQVPGGGIEPDETPLEGMKREVLEETGLKACVVERELAVDLRQYEDHLQERHFFWLSVADAPDEWDHVVSGKGEDNGLIFHYFWVSSPTEVTLILGHGDYLAAIFNSSH
ncbi:MAG TPA: NUDIX domain-containing protein [Ktedonobacterales bacterium]|jgi:8-oxo-dGTP pyrophosphatase MutT (NUDIX family)